MRKKTIAILFGIGFGLVIVASIVYFGGIISLASAVTNCDYANTTCDTSAPTGVFSLLIVGVLLYLAGGVLTTISWIAILIKQAQRQQWAWFVCTLLFHAICMLIWLIVEPEVPGAPLYVPVYQPIQPGYPPVYPTDGPYPHTSYPSAEQPYYQDPYNRQ